jgi:basic amino acid/polyamine antiporter, APA family
MPKAYNGREGAIYHWFALLGQKEHKQLEVELLNILKDKGLREGDPFGEMIVTATVTDLGWKRTSFDSVVSDVSAKFAREILGTDRDRLKKEFMDVTPIDPALIIPRVSILYGKVGGIDHPVLHIVLSEGE